MGILGRASLALALGAQLTGCSMLFVNKPPRSVPQGVWVECTEGKTWPVVDAVVGTSFVLSGVGLGTWGGSADASETDEDAARIIGPIYALMGIGVLYSAYTGFKATNHYPQPQPIPPPSQH